MHTGDEYSTAGVPGAGLCNGCLHQRVVESGRGSRFSLCRRAAGDARLVRYPPLPVVRCTGYEPAAPPGGSDDGGSSSSSASSPTSSPSSTSPSWSGWSDPAGAEPAG